MYYVFNNAVMHFLAHKMNESTSQKKLFFKKEIQSNFYNKESTFGNPRVHIS